ncbi:MAG TPA: PHP domain-containing protein [Candidatus Acidoferrum sp.]|nr:PHP domain-containing protein [Candidatus Acidoferrum sp.]
MKFADLHLHTHFSDGTFSPEELVGHARRLGFAALALTDHDSVEGCAPTAAACAAAGIEFIPGTELTAEHHDIEVHLLGYFLDIHNETLLAEIAKFQAVRQNRIREMVAKLNQLHVPLEVDAVFALANCKSPGRPHVARALTKAGLVKHLDEAFERFLRKGRPAWVPKAKMSALEGIELIHRAGGLAVMAHPGLNRTDEIIPALVEAGLDGIECFHTKHTTAMSEHYLEIADQSNLLVTGGSDCHGFSKGKPLIGTIKLPYEQVEKLKAGVESRRARAGSPRSASRQPQ